MPQLDPTWIPSQVFWLVICFGTLLFLMSKVVIPNIASVLEDRQKRIDDDLNRAEDLKNKADEVRQAYETALADARGEAEKILKNTRDELSEFAARREKEVDEKLAVMIRESEAKVQKAKDEALGQVREIASEVAAEAVKSLAGVTPDAKDVSKAVDEIMEARA